MVKSRSELNHLIDECEKELELKDKSDKKEINRLKKKLKKLKEDLSSIEEENM